MVVVGVGVVGMASQTPWLGVGVVAVAAVGVLAAVVVLAPSLALIPCLLGVVVVVVALVLVLVLAPSSPLAAMACCPSFWGVEGSTRGWQGVMVVV